MSIKNIKIINHNSSTTYTVDGTITIITMRRHLDKFYSKIVATLGSRWMLGAIIALFVLQALWIVFSFRYPMVYDESFHFPVIQIFSHELDPFITDQPSRYDTYGDLQYSSSVFYHYLMSWPYRAIESITQYEPYQVIALRVLNVAMAAAGLFVFSRLFRQIKIKQTYINAGLLVFTMLPIVPFVAAHVSYDNLLFLLTPAYLIFAVKIIQSRKIIWADYAWLVTLGCFAALVKFTFLPIFAASMLFLTLLIFKRHGKRFFNGLWSSAIKTSKKLLIVTVSALVLFAGLFSVNYLIPLAMYGSPKPSCMETMSKDRCMTGRNGYLVERGQEARATKDTRQAMNLSAYTNKWFDIMLSGTVLTAANTPTAVSPVSAKSPPILISSLYFFVVFGLAFLLYSWRSLRKNYSWFFLIITTLTLVFAVFYTNLSGYRETHQFFANQPRYLLSVVPIVSVMIAAATAYAFRQHRWVKLGIFTSILLLFTQGGGVVTHILRSDDSWYWQHPTVIEANHKAKAVLEPLVKEN